MCRPVPSCWKKVTPHVLARPVGKIIPHLLARPACWKNHPSFAGLAGPIAEIIPHLLARPIGEIISHLPARPGMGLGPGPGLCRPLKQIEKRKKWKLYGFGVDKTHREWKNYKKQKREFLIARRNNRFFLGLMKRPEGEERAAGETGTWHLWMEKLSARPRSEKETEGGGAGGGFPRSGIE